MFMRCAVTSLTGLPLVPRTIETQYRLGPAVFVRQVHQVFVHGLLGAAYTREAGETT